MRKIFFTTILLFLALGQMWGGTRRIYFDFSAVTMWDDDTELAGGTGYVGVHCWGSGTLSDTNYHMSATGTANLAYADIDDSFTSVCFFRAASDNTWWNQTQDRSDITTNNRFKIKDAKGEYDADKGKYLWADSDAGVRWSPGPAIDGLIDVNNPHNQMFEDGVYEVTLSEHSTYQFTILDGTTAYGLNNNVWTGSVSNYGAVSGEYAYRVATAGAGTYTFTWDNTNKKLSVTYPSVTHPTADYCYLFDHGWSNVYIYLSSSESGIAGTDSWGTKTTNRVQIGSDYYYYFAPGDYTDLMVSDATDANKATGLTPNLGQYQKNIDSSWGWHTFSFNVEEHNNGGRIWEDSVGSYTFGVGATLPTNVTKWGYDFAGWYDNAGLEGDPVTAITTSDTGNKDYYAKWTSIVQEYPIASHPEFLAAQEGDIITVTVTGVHTSADIYLQYTNGTTITNRSLSEAGTYTFQLSADAAAEIRTNGLLVTGQNFTFSDVNILYRKTIWSGSISDNTGWTETAVEKSIFSGLSGGDFLGFNISAINDGETWHQYAMRADYDNVLSGTRTETGIAIHQLSADQVTALADSNRIDITTQYLDISNLYSYTHTRVYTAEEHTNGGRIWADSVGSYTFGVGATLPTSVTKWNHNFGGWYDNAELEGEPVTAISTTDNGNKQYYAKWTSILKEYPVASHPEFLAVQEGDIIVVNVTSVQTSAAIYLYDLNYTEITHVSLSETGTYTFQLSAAAAAGIRTYGLLVTGQNYTFDDVEIRYRKTIWTGPLNAEDNWEEEAVEKSIFSGLSEGDFLGFDISKINTGEYHQYSMRADYDDVLSGARTETGIAIHQLSAADITALTDSDRIDIVAQYLEIAHLYAYSGIFVIYRTGDAPDGGGGIETFDGGSIDSPIEYRMKVHTLDQWYSLYLPFDVDAIKVIEDGIYYDIQPYYRLEVGGTLYQGHYFIRTPAKTTDFEIANFSDWRDPSSYVFTPAGKTPYVIRWHDSYFLNKYISFFGHTDAAIPETMTVGDRPTKDSVVNVYGNDAMVSGSVVDGYTLEPDYGNGSWLREETIGDSRTVLPFECYLRANTVTTPIFKVVRKQDVTTAIPMTNDPLSMPHKVLINGQVVILRDNKMYNVLGMEIQ